LVKLSRLRKGRLVVWLRDRHIGNRWCSRGREVCLLIYTRCCGLGCSHKSHQHVSVKGSGKLPVELRGIHAKRNSPFVRTTKDSSPYQFRISDGGYKRKTNGLGALLSAP